MSDWDGSPVTLPPNDSRNLPQTTNGSMILLYANLSKGNNAGELSVSSGGTKPENVHVAAGTNQPEVMIRNWQAQNLRVTNTSSKDDVDIYVAAYGPGLNPINCIEIAGSSPNPLSTMSCLSGNASPKWMTLRFSAQSGDQTIFGLIGGPVSDDNNAYVFGLNMPSNSGPPANQKPQVDGYYQTTDKNKLDFQFNWGSSRIWVVNLSSANVAVGDVTLLSG
jgi:hypothetical protein